MNVYEWLCNKDTGGCGHVIKTEDDMVGKVKCTMCDHWMEYRGITDAFKRKDNPDGNAQGS